MPEDKLKSRKGRGSGDLPRISDAEWVVMKVVWERVTLTTNQVVDALHDQTDWKPKTIHTLLSRLVRKGALGFEKKGREYLFRPLVTAEECEYEATRSFLGRFFGGELAPFLARFVEKEKLKPDEIEELKRILDGKQP
jgi:BlaI family penicillinase repressor